MKRGLVFFSPFLFGIVLLFTLFGFLSAKGKTLDNPGIPSGPEGTELLSTSLLTAASNTLNPEQTLSVLIWPEALPDFIASYPTWEQWVLFPSSNPFVVRNNILVVVQALAFGNPALTIDTLEPDSDVIRVTGSPSELWRLVARLENYPLIHQITEDDPYLRTRAATAWEAAAPDPLPAADIYTGDLVVNVRHNWVWNIIWGYTAPNANLDIVLNANNGTEHSVSVEANDQGLYLAYLDRDIQAGDVVHVDDGRSNKVLKVPSLAIGINPHDVQIYPPSKDDTFSINNIRFASVVLGSSIQAALTGFDGPLQADFTEAEILPGTPGFVTVENLSGDTILAPLAVNVVKIRYSTVFGFGSINPHVRGLNSIVHGNADPFTTITVTHVKSGHPTVTRTLDTAADGSFMTSVDRLIEDGDLVEVRDSGSVNNQAVPDMTYQVNLDTKIITGTAPANIVSTVSGGPHTLQLTLGRQSINVTTDGSGNYTANFSSLPYVAGQMGEMSYVTPDGNVVYKPIFVVEPLQRGVLNDTWADLVLGKPDFSEITLNEVTGDRLFNPMGVHVDDSVQPNRVYAYDAGNSRILGLSHLGTCQGGSNAGGFCTTNSDCPGSVCTIDEGRSADLVLGQIDMTSSTCNGDSGFQTFPQTNFADAQSFCGLREQQVSITEGGSGLSMESDADGNLYVPDFFNNRILRYDDPFNTDTIADYVWGQPDFNGMLCNSGATNPNARLLCLSPSPGLGDLRAGVTLDSLGNMWVADATNNRVVRFPNPGSGLPALEADLVLGQPDFQNGSPGTGLAEMWAPGAVRVSAAGAVYVADSRNNRVSVFEPPFTNGMAPDRFLGGGLNYPTGLVIAPDGSLWVTDSGNQRFVRYINETVQDTITNVDEQGGLGIDQDGNVYSAGWAGHAILRFPPPGYAMESLIMRSPSLGISNRTTDRSMYGGYGIEIAAGQLIYSDKTRLLFWDNPWDLQNYQAFDGYIGVPDLFSRDKYDPQFTRMRADDNGVLWVLYGGSGPYPEIRGYTLPLVTGQTPTYVIQNPLPILGGGSLSWSPEFLLGGIETEASCDCLWVSDEGTHRVFRIRDVTTSPMVDVILGQLDETGVECNQGRGLSLPSQDSLCHPGPLTFDNFGNLFVSDHNAEFDGNLRLLEFDAASLPANPPSAVFGIPADRVYGRNGDFTAAGCPPDYEDPLCAPWEPAFNSQNGMAIGFNPYLSVRFMMFYQDPLNDYFPYKAFGDFHSWPHTLRYDQFDNLYALDHNRSRILIYQNQLVQTYEITGTVTDALGDPVEGVGLDLTRYTSQDQTGALGTYTLTGLITGTYTLNPTLTGCTFTPITQTLQVPTELTANNFVANCGPLTKTLTFNPGWNLTGLQLQSDPALTAEGKLDDIRVQGGDCTEIDRWLNGGWDAHIHNIPANDFDLALGEGYFTRCSGAVDWSYSAAPLEDGLPLGLNPGWNLANVPFPPDGYSAESLLDSIESEGGDCTEIDRWLNGGWDAHIHNLPFNDFSIAPDQGYFIRCNTTSTYTPTIGDLYSFPTIAHDSTLIQLEPAETPAITAVQVTNLRDSALTLVWFSDQPSAGRIEFGPTSALGVERYDDRGTDYVGIPHQATLTGLTPNTTYYVRVYAGETFADSVVTTKPSGSIPTPFSIYGQVLTSAGDPAVNAQVSLAMHEPTGDGQPISALVDPNGYWFTSLLINDCEGVELEIEALSVAGELQELTIPACSSHPAPTIFFEERPITTIHLPILFGDR